MKTIFFEILGHILKKERQKKKIEKNGNWRNPQGEGFIFKNQDEGYLGI